MNRIEPGCLVLIIHATAPELVGKCATVVARQPGEFVNHLNEKVDGAGWWVLDVPDEEMECCRPASSLLRIDDDSGIALGERRDEEISA